MVIKVGLPSVRVKKITVGSPIFRTAAAGSTTLFNIAGAKTDGRTRGHILVFDSAADVGGAYTTSSVKGVNGITTAFAPDSDTFTVTLNALTTNIPEGTNLYYTRARADSDHENVRTDLIPLRDSEFSLGSPTKRWKALHVSGSTISLGTLSLHDSDGGLRILDSNGTGAAIDVEGSRDQIRGFFSAGGDLSYDSAAGRFTFDVEQVYTKANFDSDFNDALDEAVLGGSGLKYDASTNTLAIDSAEIKDEYLKHGFFVNDNSKITFGNDSDLKIFHDTNNSIIQDAGTGSLVLATNNLNVKNVTQTETAASFLSGGAVTLRFNNKTKFTTTDSGVTVTGSLRADSATIGGDLDVGGAFTTITTTGLTEGNNLYYTTARADSDAKAALFAIDAGGDGSFTYDSSSGVMTYTGPSAAEVRAHFTGNKGLVYNSSTGNFDVDSANLRTIISANDAGGDGSFSYNNATGVFTYTGPSASEVRSHFSGQGDLTYDSATGVFTIDVEQVYTKANFDSDFSVVFAATTTDSLSEGSTNLYHTTTRARASVSAGTGISYNSGTGVITSNDGQIVHDNLSGFVANEHIDHTGVSIIAGKGLTGGGTIASNRTIDVDSANLVTLARTALSGTNGISYTSGTGVIRAPQPLDSSANPTFNQLRGPSTFIIDPAAVGDNTGTVRILGDLTVEGVTTTINSTTLSVNDKNIQIADSAADSSALDGGGITWGGTAVTNSPTFNYSHSNARFEANRDIATNLVGNVTGNVTGNLFGVDYIRRPHSTSTVNFAVTVVTQDATHRYNGQGSSNKYAIDGVQSPFLELTPGRTYRFTLSASDMSNHPFRFYYEAARNTQYTNNVTSTSTYTEITVTDATPAVLHYQCSSHGYMGNAVFTNSRNFTGFDTDDLAEGSSNQYHTTSRARGAISGGTGISYNSGTGAITTNDGQIVHDNLSGFVANEHIDHTAVSIIAGKGLTGGGTIASNRTIDIDSDNIKSFSIEAISGNKGLTYNSSTGVMDVDSSNIQGIFTGGSGISISSGVIKLDSAELAASYSTSNLPEGTNKYYTDARADSAAGTRIANTSTDSISEGSTNLYLTNERIDDRIAALLIGGTNITVTYSDDSDKLRIDGVAGGGGFDLSGNDTDDISEGSSNLYFANSRARAAISGNKGLTYNSSTGVMDVDSANLVALSRAGISVTGEGSYNSSTGVITLPTLGTHYIDSAIGLALIDANALDSGRATGLIDSAYVQLRQTSAVGDGGIAMAIALG